MKYLKLIIIGFIGLFTMTSCDKDATPVANDVTLHFNNTFKNIPIVLGDAQSASATTNMSAAGQVHHFSELKYVISNIRLIRPDGSELPYHVNDLDKGATVVNHAKSETLDFVLKDIPAGELSQIKFGLGVKYELNTLDAQRFPGFYANAGANDTEMHWEWGTGYRFTKIEGFFGENNDTMSIHTGSTLEKDEKENDIQGRDAYRDITLDLTTHAIVGQSAPVITIKADFDHLLSGTSDITLSSTEGNYPGADLDKPFRAIPVFHTANQMEVFVNNLGGKIDSSTPGMFSIEDVQN